MTSEGFIGGIDLGGTKILSVCVDFNLTIVGQDQRPTPAQAGVDAVIAAMVASMRQAAAGRQLTGVGISTPGPSNPKTGTVSRLPNLAGWKDVPLARRLGEALATDAWLENDGHCAGLAEHAMGAGSGTQNMILVAIGTGLGGALILDGQLYAGVSGAGGEIGHMKLVDGGQLCGCGRHGCLETLVAGRYLGEQAHALFERQPAGILGHLARASGQEPDVPLLEAAADAGDAGAEAILLTAGRYLGAGLTNLANIFNPELFVIAGSLRKLRKRYLEEAIAVLEAEAFPQVAADVRVVETALGDEAAALGAVLTARAHLGLPLPRPAVR